MGKYVSMFFSPHNFIICFPLSSRVISLQLIIKKDLIKYKFQMIC